MARHPADERHSAAYLCTRLLQIRSELISKALYTPSHDAHLRELVGITLWKDSEADGKIHGCRFWSHGALASQEIGNTKDLQHEHVFPKRQLIDILFELKNPGLDRVQGLIQELNIAAVVTKEEHRRLGTVPGSRGDVWQRYRLAGIQWVDRSSE